MRSSDASKKPNLILIVVYSMTQLRMFPLIFANALAAPGRDQELYLCLTRIEGELKQRAFDVFEALDELNKPNGDHSNAIRILKSNINNESLREIYSCTQLEMRKNFRLHHQDLFVDLSEKEKLNLANKLAAPGYNQQMESLIKRIKDSGFLMALDQLTVPGDEHEAAIKVLSCLNNSDSNLLRRIFPYLSEDVKIMLSHDLVILADLNLNKPNSKRSRLSRRFP